MGYKEDIYRKYVSNHNQSLYGEISIHKIESAFKLWDHLYSTIIPEKKDSEILEIGCGEGGFVHYLTQRGYTNTSGVDVSQEQIEIGRSLGINNIHKADLQSWLKENKESYDMVLARDVLEHFKKSEVYEILSLVRGSLRPGGSVVFQSPNGEGIMVDTIYEGDFTHSTKFTENSARQVLKTIGFEQIKCFPLLFPVRSVKSLLRMMMWKFIEMIVRFKKKVIYGSSHGVFTPNLLVSAKK